jgi:signal transduction histidine kinase
MSLATLFSALGLGCYFALMFLTLRHNRRRPTNRAFVLYLSVMTFWQFAALMVSLSQNPASALFWYRFMTAGMAGSFIFFLFFTLVFLGVRQPGWFYVGWGIFVVLLISIHTPWVIDSVYQSDVTEMFVPRFGPVVPLLGLTGYLFLGYAVFSLGQGYRRTRSEVQRNRIKYLLLAAGAVALGSFSNLMPTLQDYPIDIAFNVLSALLIAYAILRHHLLDVRVVLRKGLLYSIPTVLISVIYFSIISLAINLFHAFAGPQLFLVSLIVAVATAVLIQPLRARAQNWIDRLFFREKYDSRLMLQRISQQAAYVLDTDHILNLILNEVATTMQIGSAAFFLKEEESGRFVLAAQRGLELETALSLGRNHGVVAWLSHQEEILTKDDIDFMPQFKALWSQERQDLAKVGAEILIPVKTSGELVGIFAVGPKLSEETYAQDDQLTLATLANQTAMAIDNARLFTASQQELRHRKQVEQRLRQQTAHLQALNQITAAAAAATDLHELLETALDLTVQALGLKSGAIWLNRQWQPELEQRETLAPTPTGPVLMLRGLPVESGPVVGHIARVSSTDVSRPVIERDIQQTSVGTLAHKLDIHGALTAPILAEGEHVGGVSLMASETRRWSAAEVDLVANVGRQLGTTAERLRLFQDVRTHADQLEIALAQAQELEQLKSQFIQNVSHELRTPLGILRGYAELLHDGDMGPLTPQQKEVSEIVVRRAKVLSELISDITLILDAEQRPLKREPVALDQLARTAVEDFYLAAEQADLTLELMVPTGLPAVRGESGYLRRVLDNLIGNAIKFTPAGEAVQVRLAQQDSHVVMEVTDTGIGVPAEELELIFERFYQVDGSSRRRYGGVGLGLALVKQVVEALDGTVEVESELDRGSTFTVRLPIAG